MSHITLVSNILGARKIRPQDVSGFARGVDCHRQKLVHSYFPGMHIIVGEVSPYGNGISVWRGGRGEIFLAVTHQIITRHVHLHVTVAPRRWRWLRIVAEKILGAELAIDSVEHGADLILLIENE